MNAWKEKIRTMQRSSVVIYPTETSYAIGCDATNARVVRAIFRLKGRERGKPLPLIVASRAMAERYAQFTPLARRLARQYWPGPLTIVVASRKLRATSRSKKNSSPPPTGKESPRGGTLAASGASVGFPLALELAPGVIASDGTIALRISSHPIARALSRRFGGPIVSTSANRSGHPSCSSVRAVLRSFRASSSRHAVHLLSRGGSSSDGGPLPLIVIVTLPFPVSGRTPGMSRRAARRGVKTLMCARQTVAVIDVGALPLRRPSTIVDARGATPVILRRGAEHVTLRSSVEERSTLP